MAANSSIGLVLGALLGLVAGAMFVDPIVGLLSGAGIGLVLGAGFPSSENSDPKPPS